MKAIIMIFEIVYKKMVVNCGKFLNLAARYFP